MTALANTNTSMIDFSIFSDSVDAIIEVGEGVVALTSLPAHSQESYMAVVDKTVALLDHYILLVTHRLSDCLLLSADGYHAFLNDLSRLQMASDWEKMERDARLCRALRDAGDEMRHLFSSTRFQLSLGDNHKFWILINHVLEGKTLFTSHLAQTLHGLSQITDVDLAKNELSASISALNYIRVKLIVGYAGVKNGAL